MCKASKRPFFVLCAFLLFAPAADAQQAVERWYLISGAELSSIEQYKEKSEREKQSWLLQARALRQDSADSNAQLAQAREQNRRLEQSFNEYEAEKLIQLSLKNGEIADLNRELAEQTLETERYKGIAWNRLIIIVALGAAWIIFIAFKALRFFRII